MFLLFSSYVPLTFFVLLPPEKQCHCLSRRPPLSFFLLPMRKNCPFSLLHCTPTCICLSVFLVSIHCVPEERRVYVHRASEVREERTESRVSFLFFLSFIDLFVFYDCIFFFLLCLLLGRGGAGGNKMRVTLGK